MKIGGLQKFSLLDYPEHLAAIVFTQGCNFRCQFCYNPMLVLPETVGKINDNSSSNSKNGEEIKEGASQISENAFFDFLDSRAGKLDAVVVTGGEPTMHADLPDFISAIRNRGFKVKLDTNGTNPDMLGRLLAAGLLDYIAMDLKTALPRYETAVGVRADTGAIRQSIRVIMDAKRPYEFRTTAVPGLVEIEDIEALAGLIKGAAKWHIQRFKSDISLVNNDFQGLPAHSEETMSRMQAIGQRYVQFCGLR